MKQYHVLVVEDNMINRAIAVSFLERFGFELEEASSGEEAVGLVHRMRYDMIFMDQMMPGMDGMETARKIRQECGDNGKTPVIVALTSSDIDKMREAFLQSGFQDVLGKPLTQDKMERILAKWLPDAVLQTAPGAEEEDSGFDQIRIPGIDIAEARKNHPGDVEKYIQILRIYYIDSKRKLAYLRKLLDGEDIGNYEIEVHALKSASASIGAMSLSAQAKAHEKAASQGDIEFIRDNSELLLDCYGKLGKAIQYFLEASQEKADAGTEEIDRAVLCQKLGEALKNLEHFRSRECTARIEELLQYRLDLKDREKLQGILEELKLYEDDNAERLLRNMLQDMEKEEIE